MFDLRLPSGLFFTLVGAILVVLGIFDANLRAPMTNANVNLYAGLFMLAFGLFMLRLARRAARRQQA